MERKILDSQERAFWDVYRPAPGCVNTIEIDIRKTMRTRRTDHPNIGFFRSKQNTNTNKTTNLSSSSSPIPAVITTLGNTSNTASSPSGFLKTNNIPTTSNASNSLSTNSNTSTNASASNLTSNGISYSPVINARTSNFNSSAHQQQQTSFSFNQKLCESDEMITLENLKKEKDFLKRRLERRYVKTSKVSESYTNYFEQYIEFDPFITPPDPSNPWIADSTEFWDMEKSMYVNFDSSFY